MIAALCAERGISGDEKRVREKIVEALSGCCANAGGSHRQLIAEKDVQHRKTKLFFLRIWMRLVCL
jgi:putative aminopeptidase FrvX